MPQPVRVLIADDSAVIRRLLTEVLQSDAEIEVLGAARNGAEALDRIAHLRPDCVVLDVEMPVMDGLETVRRLRQLDRTIPILMFSALTARGAETSLEALALGATDVAVKPSNVGHVGQAIDFVKRELVPRIKLLGARNILRRTAGAASSTPPMSLGTSGPRAAGGTTVAAAPRPAAPPPRTVSTRPFRFDFPRSSRGSVELVAIGASTGGPNALAEVIRQIDEKLPAPILIVQHMPPLFTQLLAERLNASTPLTVREARSGERVRPGDVWIAAGNYHMTVARQGYDLALQLNQNAPVNSCRPSVDVLFSSVAEAVGGRALGVVLTGMGRDGRDGAADMRAAGARILTQTEATCVVYGMPRAIVEANLADQILPLAEIAPAINRSCLDRAPVPVGQS